MVPAWQAAEAFQFVYLLRYDDQGQVIKSYAWEQRPESRVSQLRGSFELTLEPSPFVRGVNHLHFNNADLRSVAQDYSNVMLPAYVTHFESSGELRSYADFRSDPFSAWPWSNYGYWVIGDYGNGRLQGFSGVFDGATLAFDGESTSRWNQSFGPFALTATNSPSRTGRFGFTARFT